MSWTSKSSSRDSSRSSSSSGRSSKDYALSLNIYGEGSVQGSPAHWGTMISKRGAKNGDLYHVRKNEDFYYDPPKNSRPVESTTTYGRSEIRHLSRSRKTEAERVLSDYGNNHANLPRGTENCQNWTVGALGALEREGLAPEGTKSYWTGNIGKPSDQVGDQLRRDGKSWIPKPKAEARPRGRADATFGREQAPRPVGRLNLDKFAGLSGSSKPSKRM